MKSRIEYIIKQEGLSNQRFAGILGVSPGSIAHILSGRNNPSIDMVARLASRFPAYNLRWLILGEEPILRTLPHLQEPERNSVASTFDDAITTSDKRATDDDELELLPQIHTKLSGPYAVKMPNDYPIESQQEQCSISPQDRLIICYPDKTFDEYSRR